jgi:hypothetical protein
MTSKELISGIVILVVTFPVVSIWNVVLGVRLDTQAIYGGMLGALLGIGLDRLVAGLSGSK